jgi:hypothetical protein
MFALSPMNAVLMRIWYEESVAFWRAMSDPFGIFSPKRGAAPRKEADFE